MRKLAMKSAFGLAMMLPVAAIAETAYVNTTVNMRAGPNAEFPLVASIQAGAPVYINGCISGYSWCDVSAGPDRGWVYADYLSYPYQNQPVTVISGGAAIGLPIISFAVGNYWDSYYRARPWYGNRSYWYGRPANWWYRPAPRYYAQPVVRPYPGGRYDNDRRWHDDRRYDNSRRYNDNNRTRYQNDPPRYNNPQRYDNRPPQRQDNNRNNRNNQVRGTGESTLNELNREARRQGSVQGEDRQASPSARTYSQQ